MSAAEILAEAQQDGYHLGSLVLSVLKKFPDEINQINASTGEKETNASVLSRSVRLAKCLRRLGLKPGDVFALSGRNHLDLHIAHYAALFNGLPLVGVDPLFKYEEVLRLFKIARPSVAFCQYENVDDFERASKALKLGTKVITFGEGECTLQKFVDSYDEDGSLDGFEPASFDLDKVYCWLIATSGTTGTLKIAAFKHQLCMEQFMKIINNDQLLKFSQGQQMSWLQNLALMISPVQWSSAFFNVICMPLLHQTHLMTSADLTTDHVIDIINKYKPRAGIIGPALMTSILNHEKKCDLTCFFTVSLVGSQVFKDILLKLKECMPNSIVLVGYGQTEAMGPVLMPSPAGPLGNCGIAIPTVQVKLVDPETGREVTEPNMPGELWTKGPRFTEYYKNPVQTAKAFSEDGWYKTGDIFYRDENGFFFFVERLGMLIKYRNYHVIPAELEELIRTHPEVYDVGVTSIPHPEDVEHPVACVVRRPGSNVTAEDIKKLVADKLSDAKQLRGGVVFMDKLPLTSVGKPSRLQLRKLIVDAKKE